MMTSPIERESQALDAIAHGLAGSDPRLASMLNIFSRLAAGEEMPAREKIRIRRGWPPARPRRARRRPRRGTARLGRPQAMLLLWVGISAGLIAVALALNTSGHHACVRSMGTACLSLSIPRHADASHMMNVRLLAEAFSPGQSAGWAIVQLDPQARMIGNACTRTNGARGRRSAGYPPQALPSPTLDAKEYLSCTGTESRPCWPSPQLPAPW
jgi:hypothetical protein